MPDEAGVRKVARKSSIFLVLFSVGCTGLSAYLNCADGVSPTTLVQPHWMIALHIGAALLGSLLFALFVLGTPGALRGPVSESSYAVGMVPRIGAVRFFIPADGAFFSAFRIAQLLGVILCLMIQFVSVAPLDATNGPQKSEGQSGKLSRGRLTT
ncbi:hypothetical protein [Burkholderia sp. Bp8998]|uniref:hypothetical protein n=1 Tax=Burkholderia sp. Bp8998 TaxID=2184557 RepID=UPI000F5ABA57|nr:hypothetical protein [Burkholderia sp. Bp8998]